MHQIAATAQGVRQLSGALQIADDRLATVDLRSRIADERADRVPGASQLPEHVAADETRGAG